MLSLLPALLLKATMAQGAGDRLLAGFLEVPQEHRMRMYWRIFGPAWTRPEIASELDQLKAVGVGGVVAYFVYPLALDDAASHIHNEQFGSKEFLDTLGFAARAAKQRGLKFGVNGGTGWPYGGPTVSVADAAKKLKEVVLRPSDIPPQLAEGERLVYQEKSDRLTKLFIESPTRQVVKRAAVGGEGLVLDHFNRPALQRYIESVLAPTLNAAPEAISSLGCDSLEVYSANWCSDLPKVFRRSRGYELLPVLPVIFGDPGVQGNAARFDYWRTLMELTERRFTRTLGAWCDKRGVSLEMEAYGTPPNPMTAFGAISMPTGEHYEWRGFSVQKFVASAAHINRKNLIGSEAWTWAGLPNRLADSLSDLKLVTDMTLLSGSNDLTAVDYPYSPPSEGQPGWVPYYGPFMNANNPQWMAFPGLVAYVNRCQWMLRHGTPSAQVAIYLPVEDKLATGGMDQMQLDFLVRDHLVTGKATSEFGLQNGLKHNSALIHSLIESGLDYDGIDFWAMDELTKVDRGVLNAGTSSYRAVVLPRLATMEIGAARKLHEFCASGGIVVASGTVPVLPAGRTTAGSNVEFRKLMGDLFGDAPVVGRENPCKEGFGLLVGDDGAVASAILKRVKPEVVMSPIPETVGFVHRTLGRADIDFFANVGEAPVEFSVKPARTANSAELWDAMTGTVRAAPKSQEGFAIKLSPRSSVFLITGRLAGAEQQEPGFVARRTISLRTWRVKFEGPDSPKSTKTTALDSWTNWPGGKYFSGVGVYSTTVDIGEKHERARLRFSQIRECAEVWVNGARVGYLFNPPLDLDIGQFLKSGTNEIQVRVANLPVNRFLGLPDQDLGPLRAHYGNRFQAPQEKSIMKGPAPSGLIGPVDLDLD